MNGKIVVVATEGTVQGGAYQRAIGACRPEAEVTSVACPLFVALAEEGWTSGEIVESVARRYLGKVFAREDHPDTLLLGCTHFPALRGALERVVGERVRIVDSAETTAVALRELLLARRLLRAKDAAPNAGMVNFFATDGQERFARVAAVFLGRAVDPGAVALVDVGFASGPVQAAGG